LYIGYSNDRKTLEFEGTKDINSNVFPQFKSTLKNSVAWIIKKGKHTVILLFSKEVLVAVFIFLEFSCKEGCVIYPSLLEVCPLHITKLDQTRPTNNFNLSPTILDFISKLKGGSDDEWPKEEEELLKSILAKVENSGYSKTSINKYLKKAIRLIKPIVTNQKL